ncbi:autotransporter-associated beta strand repeat-containing protein [Luteolibacter arcticus]|uniref:Autotransporter-associated beta strand repeat-containing protein n=1 Tax=Luteolibacter arcticus TaxID=1581411 RepID=A0ABT3GQC4_9BACT|nr:autotransporter-associated beta strand repeat-containing protein [Luteolibacter arcticus]MCW1925685.1 autotransporter-associated beta strand repeat-containing protein [Luteolibacter arcticus]
MPKLLAFSAPLMLSPLAAAAAPVAGVTATASTSYVHGSISTANLVNNSGLSVPNDVTATHAGFGEGGGGNGWHSSGGVVDNEFVTLNLNGTYNIAHIHLWQMSQTGNLGRGVKQIDLLVSTNGTDFTPVASDLQLTQSAGGPVAAQTFPINQAGITHVRIGIDSAWSGATNEYVGLSEVKFTEGVLTETFAPTFSLAAGTYLGERAVTVSCGTPGATIYYTTNGSPPTNTSSSGSTGLTVNLPVGTTTLQAYGHLDGNTDSGIASATYTIQATSSGVWTNAAGGSWSQAANWQGNVIPVGATADFGTLNLTADTQVTLDGPRTMSNLIFGDTTPSNDWILNAGTEGPLTLDIAAGTPSIAVNNRTATLDLVLAGSKGLNKTGSGTLALTGANTYTGVTALNEGTLRLADLASHRSSVVMATTTICEANLATNVSAAQSFNITGTGTLVKTGAGTWFTGSAGRVGISLGTGGLVDIQAGTLSNGAHQQSWTGNQGSVHIAAGATLDIVAENVPIDALTGAGSLLNSYPPSGTRTTTVGIADGSGTFSGVISSGVLALNKAGSGNQILTGANTYTGATTISGGTLQLGNGGTSGSLSTSSTITTNGTLAFNRSDDVVQGIHFSGNAIGGTGGLTQTGPGILTLTASNGYTGPTAVTGGGLVVDLNPGTTWNVADLDLASGTSLSLRNFASDSGNPALDATASLAAHGTVTLSVAGTFSEGTFPLLYYPSGSVIGGEGFAAFTLGTLPSGVEAHLENNEENFSVDLVVTEVAGYQGWIGGFTFEDGADLTVSGDADHDGLDNGLEYALGLAPNQSNGSPGTFTGSQVSFTKGAEAIANRDVTYVIEISNDLGLADPWTAVVTHAPPDASATISYTFTGGETKGFARLKVTNH